MKKQLSQVAWHDGMLLGPQHFRSQARYSIDMLASFPAGVGPSWGIWDCQFDSDALDNDKLVLASGCGRLSDGSVFSIDRPIILTGVLRAVEKAHDQSDGTVVFLELVKSSPSTTGVGLSDTRKYAASRMKIGDPEFRYVDFVDVGFRLALDDFEPDTVWRLPLARIERRRSGKFEFDPTFVPPCLHILASEWLVNQFERLLVRLSEKNEGGHGTWQRVDERALFQLWFLPTVSWASREIGQVLGLDVHPSKAFGSLARIAGILGTAADLAVDSLPTYDHVNPHAGFASLFNLASAMLDLILPPTVIPVELESIAPSLFLAIGRQHPEYSSRWILALYAPNMHPEAVSGLVKVAPASSIESVAMSAIRGLPLRLVPLEKLPPGIEARSDWIYFEAFNSTGPASGENPPSSGTTVVDQRGLGVYIPTRFFGTNFKLYNLSDK